MKKGFLIPIGLFAFGIIVGLANIIWPRELKVVECNHEQVMTDLDNYDATVTIRTIGKYESRTGSGVIWDLDQNGRLVVLTAKHCVDEYQTVFTDLVLGDGEEYMVYDFYLCPDSDIAFISLERSSIPEETLAQLKEVKYDKDIIDERGLETYTMGKHSQKGLIFGVGQCTTSKADRMIYRMLGRDEFMTNIQLIGGASGGGVYNEAGYLLGIVSKSGEAGTTYVGIQSVIEYAERAFEYGEGYGTVDINYLLNN